MKIAIVGSGISGMVSAYLLSKRHEVTVFEANDYIGGHTRTIEVTADDGKHAVDTGFIVYNEKTYPHFTRLLQVLGVATEPTRMSFSVRSESSGLEYNGTSLNALFSQRRNLISPSFYRMVLDILRFFKEAPAVLHNGDADLPLGDYLEKGGYSQFFIHNHIIPMAAAIWSADPQQMLEFPARYLIQFFHNHGFLSLHDRPAWRVVSGGSFRYISRLTQPFRHRIQLANPVTRICRHPGFVEVSSRRQGTERFDFVVIAGHSDQALRMLEDPSEAETEILQKIPYRTNHGLLHTDHRMLPRRKRARAAWNYHIPQQVQSGPAVTYYMNQLQNLDAQQDFCVTLNRADVDPELVLQNFSFDHPVYSDQAVRAQQRFEEISGQRRTFFCGAYWGHGFHEDGVKSALNVGRSFGAYL